MNRKIVTLGELTLRLSPFDFERFVQTDKFEVIFGGAEANVAIALANLGDDVRYLTKLVENEMGQAALNNISRFGIDTDYIVRGGERLGIYYAEKGVGLRSPKVIYDRKSSSMAKAKIEEFDWDGVFKDVGLYFTTGITAAISKEGRDLVQYSIKEAKKRGLVVVFDLNYRASLWSLDEACEFYDKVLPMVDILIGVLPTRHECFKGDFNHECLSQMLKEIHDKYHIKYTISSIRNSFSASINSLSAGMYNGREYLKSQTYKFDIVDRIGGGDAFAAGLIHAYVNGYDIHDALDFAIALSALKHSIIGDYALFTEKQVGRLVSGDKHMLSFS